MFIFSVKPNKRKLFLYIMFSIIIAMALLFIIANTGKKKESPKPKAAAAIQAENNDERINFLKKYNWCVKEEPVEVKDIIIPLEFNETYNKYNEIQKNQSMNLEEYKGKLAKKYTYEVTNYEGATEKVYANLIVYQDKVVAADISSAKLDGFMHGLKKK